MPPSSSSVGVLQARDPKSGVLSASSVFNRDAAKSLILGKLPSAKLAAAGAPSATGHKLIETLATLSKQADKENPNMSGLKSMLKAGGARRVPMANANAASPAASNQATAAAAAASAAALSSATAAQQGAEAKLAQVEGEKQLLQQQIDALRKETQSQSAALAAVQQQLADKDAAAAKLQSLASQLQQQLAAQAAELAQARASIAQLQHEKEALQAQVNNGSCSSAEVDSRATTVLTGPEHAPLLAHLNTASNNASAAVSEDATATVAAMIEQQQRRDEQEEEEDEDGDDDTAVVFAVRAEQQSEQPMANDEDTALVTFAAATTTAVAEAATPSPATVAGGMAGSDDDDVTAAQPVALFQTMREPLEAAATEEEEAVEIAPTPTEDDAADESVSFAVSPAAGEDADADELDRTMPEPAAAAAAEQTPAHAHDHFEPVTADDMEASLNDSADPFALSADEEHAAAPSAAAAASSSSRAAAAASAAVNESSSSLNLSVNTSALSATGSSGSSSSPFRAGPLPASFLSNPNSPSLGLGLGAGVGAGFLSPISSSPAVGAAAAAAAAASKFSTTGLSAASSSALSNSALKLQAHFRGRMERTYLRLHEPRLAALPLTSPSTPLRASGETPLAKRQRLSNSPLGPCRMLTEEEEDDGEGLLARRELSFQAEDEDADEDVHMAVRARAPATAVTAVKRAPAAASAPLRITPVGVASSSSAASAAAGAAAAAAPISPTASSSSLAPLSILEQRRVQSELKQHRSMLSTIEQCWTLRSKAMNAIEAVVRERGPGSMVAWTAWPAELSLLQRGMSAQLCDLRSSILREACRLLIALAEASPRDFEDSAQLAFYAPLLFKGLYVTIKIISSTCDETMVEIVARVATVKSVPVVSHMSSHRWLRQGAGARGARLACAWAHLFAVIVCDCDFTLRASLPCFSLLCPWRQFLAALSDVHSVVREKCAIYLSQIVAAAQSGSAAGAAESLEPYLAGLSAAIRTQTQDQDGKVRAAWRSLFSALRAPFPAQMDALLAELPPPVQKALDMDRKQKNQNGKAAVGAKRKK